MKVSAAIGVTLFLTPLALTRPYAQSAPTFEVVSIKRPDPAQRLPRGISLGFTYKPGGKRLSSPQESAFSLLQLAFSMSDRPVRTSQIIGAPGWTQTQMYEIEVAAAEDVRQTSGVFGAMVRSMLEDRFALKAHIESWPAQSRQPL